MLHLGVSHTVSVVKIQILNLWKLRAVMTKSQEIIFPHLLSVNNGWFPLQTDTFFFSPMLSMTRQLYKDPSIVQRFHIRLRSYPWMGPCTYFHHRRHINNIFSWSSSRWTKDPSTAVASPLSYHSELQLSLWISLFSYNNHSTSKCIIYFLSIFRHVVWRRQWQPTPVLLPEKSHGRRGLVGYSPWGL